MRLPLPISSFRTELPACHIPTRTHLHIYIVATIQLKLMLARTAFCRCLLCAIAVCAPGGGQGNWFTAHLVFSLSNVTNGSPADRKIGRLAVLFKQFDCLRLLGNRRLQGLYLRSHPIDSGVDLPGILLQCLVDRTAILCNPTSGGWGSAANRNVLRKKDQS